MTDRPSDADLDDATGVGMPDPETAQSAPGDGDERSPGNPDGEPDPSGAGEDAPRSGERDGIDAPQVGDDSESDVEGDRGGEERSLEDVEQQVVDDLSVLEKERDEYLDALRRLQADFDNFRKRMVRQQTETLERAAEDLVTKLLPVLDAVDLARQHGGGEGVDQIAGALFDVLTKEGLERLGEEGEPFDPNIHEAVAHEHGDGTDQRIAQVMRPGYRWRQRLLRAAMVMVKG